MADDDTPLPPLRQDIQLIPGPTSPDGSPTWSLCDPTRNQYFRIGWLEFECLSRWTAGTANKLIDKINHETTLSVDRPQIDALIRFLITSQLVLTSAQHLTSIKAIIRKKQMLNALKSYLFFKIRLLHPDKFLEKTLPYVRPLASHTFVFFIAVIGLMSLYFVSREWTSFHNSFSYFFNFEGMFYFFCALFFVKLLHEFGHAYTAKYYGCRVTSMGIALLVFFPVFYTDTTDAWRLTSRRQRVNIAAAGIFVEIVVAIFATFLWTFLSDGPLRSAVFFIASSSWLFSLLINANPLMRFDGYYLLSDWLNISNMQQRAFALGKCHLRRMLFGLHDPVPYRFNKTLTRGLTFFAYITWVYRFFLMLGISVLVYQKFFKLLGIFLLLASVTSFIIAPVAMELLYVWRQRHRMRWTNKTVLTASGGALLLLLLIIPWSGNIVAPALLEYQQHANIFAPQAAQIQSLSVKNDDVVTTDQVILQLVDPQLSYKIAQLDRDVQILQSRIRTEFGQTEKLGTRQADPSDLASKTAELQSLKDQEQKLTIRAPIAGTITNLDDSLKIGRWVGDKMPLMEIVDPRAAMITAFVSEQDLHQIQKEKIARFYPSYLRGGPTIQAKIERIDLVTTQNLGEPYLASIYGGDIAVHENAERKLMPKDALYRVTLHPLQPVTQLFFTTRGKVQLTGSPVSLLKTAWIRMTGALIRESGF